MRLLNVVDDLPRHTKKKYSTRGFAAIRGILVHHSLCLCSLALEEEENPVQRLAEHHVASGLPSIAYHYCITPDGSIYKTNNLSTVANHAQRGYNTYNIGICVIGDCEISPPLAVQVESLTALIREILYVFPKLSVHGHCGSLLIPVLG